MEKFRFLLSGSGGQGVITMAILLAEAAVLYEGRVAVQSQSYGPEARGGATRSDVIIADEPILFPKVSQPNVLVTLTNEAAGKSANGCAPGTNEGPEGSTCLGASKGSHGAACCLRMGGVLLLAGEPVVCLRGIDAVCGKEQ